LERGGLIVATTIGDELVNSDLASIPPGTLLLLAHNQAFPPGRRGRALAEYLQSRGVKTIPGQLLTLGGALTTRLEWYSRQAGVEHFPKQLAHETVAEVTKHLMERISSRGDSGSPAFYTEMCDYAHLDDFAFEEAVTWS
jgi:hypothetical protein